MSRKIINQTRSNYNIIAQHFSKKRNYIWDDLKNLLQLVEKGDKVLDLGCGNGRVLKVLKSRRKDYLGIDFSENLISIARKKYPQANFKTADISKSETFNNLGKFDVCFCVAVLHHFPTRKSQLKLLSNVYKVLKKDGILVLTVWNLWQKKFWKLHCQQLGWKIKKGFQMKWLKVPYKISDGTRTVKKVNRFCYAFCLKELKGLLKESSFNIKHFSRGKNLCLVAGKMVK